MGIFSDEPVASVLVREAATDNEMVGIDSLTAGDPCSVGKIPGDCNDDRSIDISDAICLLDFLFTGRVSSLPCEELDPQDAANVTLVDYSSDGAINISDPIALLNYLFLAGPPHPLEPQPGCDGKSGLVFFPGCY